MEIAFRADASLYLGTGHVMRCLTLGDGLREYGANCRFICSEQPGHLLDIIRERGFEVRALLPTELHCKGKAIQEESLPSHAPWYGIDWKADAHQTLEALKDAPVDWLIVDHYGLDARWQYAVRPRCQRLMVLDDLADRRHDCYMLLDQNLGRTAADYASLVPASSKILAGPRFALLRPEFAALREYSVDRRAIPGLKQLLITMGGVDNHNATSKILSALAVCTLPDDCRVTVVLGPHAPWLEQVCDQASHMPWRTEVLTNVRDMAILMADSDLAITAAGGTCWEVLCLGLPTALLAVAANQLLSATSLNQLGAAYFLGCFDDSSVSDVEARLSCLLEDDSTRLRMSKIATSLVDGRGVDRVISALRHNLNKLNADA